MKQPETPPPDAAARLRAARAYGDLDITDISEPIGFSRQAYGHWESGKTKLNMRKYRRAAEILTELTNIPAEFFTAPDLQEALRHPRFAIQEVAKGTVQRLEPGQDGSEHG